MAFYSSHIKKFNNNQPILYLPVRKPMTSSLYLIYDPWQLVYILSNDVINQFKIRPIIYQGFQCNQEIQGQAGLANSQKNPKKKKTHTKTCNLGGKENE